MLVEAGFQPTHSDLLERWRSVHIRFLILISQLSPIGARSFIITVRRIEIRTKNLALLQEVKDFTRQEAQHSMVHRQYNNRLKAQGIEWIDIKLMISVRSNRAMAGHGKDGVYR